MKCIRCGSNYVRIGEEICIECQRRRGFSTAKKKINIPRLKTDEEREQEYLSYIRNHYGEEIYAETLEKIRNFKANPEKSRAEVSQKLRAIITAKKNR